MRGIVFDGKQLALRDGLSVRAPGAGEVTVRIVNSGVCQSDLSVVKGAIPYPTPVVLGHEGAGIVEDVGPGVSTLVAGQHVVLSTLGQCGACAACDSGRPTLCRATFGQRPTPFELGGVPHYSFANVSSFAERVVVRSNQAIPIPDTVPFDAASLIGCSVLTGTGAVWNRARVRPGESVAVIGVGGVGLNVIQAAALAGAHPIVAIDANPDKRGIALEFGATHFVDASDQAVPEAVKDLTGGWGANFVFECVGSKQLVEQALSFVDWGGSVVVLGVPDGAERVEFFPAATYLDVSIMGCRYGTSRPHADVQRISNLYLAGKLKLDPLVSGVYPLESFEELLDDMGAGRLARGVLTVASA